MSGETRSERFLAKPTEPPTGTCDWGGCFNEATTWRWDPEDRQNPRGGRWLGVCRDCRDLP